MKYENENKRVPKAHKRAGSALILVVLVVLVSMAIGTGLLTMGTNARVASLRQMQDMQARSAADAGLERALQEINNAVTGDTWSESVLPSVAKAPLAHSDSYYSIQSTYSAADGYVIQSVGTSQNRTRTVTATLRLKGLFENAIQCRNGITLKGGTVVETVNSDISLDPADSDAKSIIGTNSVSDNTIVLNNGVSVDGDVVVGIGGDVDTVIKDLGATVDEKYSLSSDVEFPVVSAPSLVSPNTEITLKKVDKTIGTGGDYQPVGQYSGIKMGNSTTLRVISDSVLYITGDVEMGQSSEILLDPDVSLTIYLDGDWTSDNNSGINNTTLKPASFMLFGTGEDGQTIDLKAKSELYGVVYAPNADLTIYSGGDLFGSFVADNFELKNPAGFYYDEALGTVKVTDEGARFVISRWNEQ